LQIIKIPKPSELKETTTGAMVFAMCQTILHTAKFLPCVTHGKVHTAMHTAKARVCRVPRAKHTANIFFFSIYIFIQFAYCLTKFY